MTRTWGKVGHWTVRGEGRCDRGERKARIKGGREMWEEAKQKKNNEKDGIERGEVKGCERKRHLDEKILSWAARRF